MSNTIKTKVSDIKDMSESKKSFDDNYFLNITKENNKLLKENLKLKERLIFYQTEIEKFTQSPNLVTQVLNVFNEKAVISLSNSNSFFVNISKHLIGKIKVGDSVLCEQKSLTILDKIDITKNGIINSFLVIDEKPNVKWEDIGGLDNEIKKIREVLELPLKKPDTFKKIGIEPPKGILIYGEPGVGKTMIAKALANKTNSTFIGFVGSELVQKFIGEGTKLVREIFKIAKKKSPSIIFIDEIDSIAAKRTEDGSGGEREVQRTFMQLLAEIDGFKSDNSIRIIAATNRKDILDDAILRAGRLERHIEIKMPDENQRLEILKIHTNKLNLEKNVDLKKISKITKNFSGAKLKALTTEAGYFAIRDKKEKISQKNLLDAINEIKDGEEGYTFSNLSFN